MMGWRAWLAFETKPGITRAQPPGTEHIWRELAKNCRAVDGKLDVAEFERWMDCIIERSHAWGEA